jgi:hypothetical protein
MWHIFLRWFRFRIGPFWDSCGMFHVEHLVTYAVRLGIVPRGTLFRPASVCTDYLSQEPAELD